MAFNYKDPINIEAVNNTAVLYGDVLKGIDKLKTASLLANLMVMPDIQSSLILGKTESGTITKKYDGQFDGDKNIGEIVPRTLNVYPVVAEISDEPERYRRSFISRLATNMWNQAHPFELFLLQHGIDLADEEMFYAIFVAKRSEDPNKKKITDSFDGFFTLIDTDITTGLISSVKENLYANGAITRANAGDYLLEMWRTRHAVLQEADTNMWISTALGNLYDDWYRDEHDNPPFVDQSGQMFLEGTGGKCKLVRTNAFPSTSQRVILTKRTNMYCGTDKLSDLKSMRAFVSGNPYKYTATMKFVWGTQFESINKREFCVNDRSGSGSGSTSA